MLELNATEVHEAASGGRIYVVPLEATVGLELGSTVSLVHAGGRYIGKVWGMTVYSEPLNRPLQKGTVGLLINLEFSISQPKYMGKLAPPILRYTGEGVVPNKPEPTRQDFIELKKLIERHPIRGTRSDS